MSMTLDELNQKRMEAINAARDILTNAEAENRKLNEGEDGKYKALMSEAADLKDRADRQRALDDAQRELDRMGESRGRQVSAGGTRRDETRGEAIVVEYRGTKRRIRPGTPEYTRNTEAYTEAWNDFVFRGDTEAFETRGLQADLDTEGGYTLPAQQAVALIKQIDDLLWIRQLGTVIPCGIEGIGVPSLETRQDDADWTGEITAVTEDTALKFGKRELKPKDLTKLIKVSRKLLANRGIDVASFVLNEMAYKHALPQEKAFLTGNGVNQPLGLFTASTAGIPTGRDFSTGNTTTAITFDGLQTAKYGLKAQYRNRPSTGWLFHRDAIAQISKLKDSDGQFIWQPGGQLGQPDRLLGYPVYESEHAPNTFTTGLYVGLIGDFSHYYIAEAMAPQIQRLDELYAATNQVGFIGRTMVDGAPVSVGGEAFARVTLA